MTPEEQQEEAVALINTMRPIVRRLRALEDLGWSGAGLASDWVDRAAEEVSAEVVKRRRDPSPGVGT